VDYWGSFKDKNLKNLYFDDFVFVYSAFKVVKTFGFYTSSFKNRPFFYGQLNSLINLLQIGVDARLLFVKIVWPELDYLLDLAFSPIFAESFNLFSIYCYSFSNYLLIVFDCLKFDFNILTVYIRFWKCFKLIFNKSFKFVSHERVLSRFFY